MRQQHSPRRSKYVMLKTHSHPSSRCTWHLRQAASCAEHGGSAAPEACRHFGQLVLSLAAAKQRDIFAENGW
jgi:hypothetical protein